MHSSNLARSKCTQISNLFYKSQDSYFLRVIYKNSSGRDIKVHYNHFVTFCALLHSSFKASLTDFYLMSSLIRTIHQKTLEDFTITCPNLSSNS